MVNFLYNFNYILLHFVLHRNRLTKKFCDALWKPSPHDYVCVRAKDIFLLEPHIEKKLRVAQRRVKSMSTPFEFQKNSLERDDESDIEPLYYQLNSILFLKSLVPPWHRYISKTTKASYVFNSTTNERYFDTERPLEAAAGFIEAYENRVVWYWPQDITLSMNTLTEMLRNGS